MAMTTNTHQVVDGYAPIGYLRRDGGKVHRRPDADANEEVVRPPQGASDGREKASWRENESKDHAL